MSEPLFEKLFEGKPEASRTDQILARFEKFFEENPRIWNLYQRFAFEVIKAGHTRYSSDAIIHRIRWHVNIETVTTEPVKLNDHYTAHYARMFVLAYPVHKDLFSLRHLTSSDRAASGTDVAVFDSGKSTVEEERVYLTRLEVLLRNHRQRNQ